MSANMYSIGTTPNDHSYTKKMTIQATSNDMPAKRHSGDLNNSTNRPTGSGGLSDSPIAICGMGMRLPGGIRSSSDLFEYLASKRDARNTVPKDRYNVNAYYNPTGKAGSTITKYGYYLDIDLSQFDTSMFNMSDTEVATMDPSQRLLLEVTREAFESAGEADFRGKNIGTYIGNFTEDWEDLQNIDLLNFAPYRMVGQMDFALSNRLAFEYDLLGPSVNIKTACSGTAEALHSAILAIRSGSCPSAIVAGANIIITPRGSIEMTAMGLLAPDGNCKTFDARANGFGRGESVCALYIKPLEDAIRDGNPIRAVIRACDSNSDGGDGSRTFGTPNALAQETLIRQTYASAGLPLSETKVIELHGTGTPIGDPLEASAIAECFAGDEKVYIGSVKPNLGHGEGGSAMASIMKSVVALENKTILPNIKFETPNPKIPWKRNLEVPVEPMTWPDGVAERISINSFGLGGSNVHIVLDSAASMRVPSPLRLQPLNSEGFFATPKHKKILLLSGNSVSAIKKMAINYRNYLETNPGNLDAMIYTLASRRERLKLATYCIVDGLTVGEPVAPSSTREANHVAFVFTGQGAQWVGMSREMMLENREFATSIRQMDEVLKTLEHPPMWTIEQTLLADMADKDLLNPTDRSQPICTAVQVAYVDALAAWNIVPSAVIGHSSGEVAAAYAAGVLTKREAIITAYYRGYACARNKVPGSMVAVGMGRDEVERYLKPGVVLACENSNISVTISGDSIGLEETMNSLKQANPNLFIRQLRVPMGYHSHHMKTIADLYNSLISSHLAPKSPRIPYYSTVYGRQVLEGKAFGPQYWQLNMESPVLFRTAVSKMLIDLRHTAHLEIGPHSALAGPLRHIYIETGHSVPYTSLAERGEDACGTFLAAIGNLYCFGIKPQVPASSSAFTLSDLPNYPWNYESSHWSESRMMADWRFRRHRKDDLLGHRILECSEIEPTWRNLVRIGDISWLADHCVQKDIVFPAAAYIAMAGTAIAQLTGSMAYTVQDVNIAVAMLITENRGTEVVTTLRKRSLTSSNDSKWWEFSICAERDGTWQKHCWGLVADGCAVAHPFMREVGPLARKVDSKRWYQALSRIGLNYGSSFIGLENITASPVNQSASVSITDRQSTEEAYALHPTTLDNIFQSSTVAVAQGEYRQLDGLFIPTFIEEFYVGANGNQATLHTRTTSRSSGRLMTGDSYGMTGDNDVVFVLNGLQGTRTGGSLAQQGPEQKAWSIQWHPVFDFVPLETLIRPMGDFNVDIEFLEQYGLMCAVEIHHEANTVTHLAQPFFKQFLAAIDRHMEQVKNGESKIPDAVELLNLSREARQRNLRQQRESSKNSPVENIIEVLWHVYTNIKGILEGQTVLVDLLLVDGVLQKFYDERNTFFEIGDFFRILGLNKPQLRILEIGAGTGGTTSVVLEAMHSSSGERLYDDYTITDVSAKFVNQTKKRFGQYHSLKFAVCDITVDPLEQEFKAGSYDLIVASDVLKFTPNLVDTLQRFRKLLKPDGQLFIQEFCSNTKYSDLIMGFFDWCWVGIDDDYIIRPAVSEQEWDVMLRQGGFHSIQCAIYDDKDQRFCNSTNILACALPSEKFETNQKGKRITLLKTSTELDQFGQGIKMVLEAEGYILDESVWGDKLPFGQDIISLIDVDTERSPLLADVDAEDLGTFIEILGNVSSQVILWLMKPAQTQCFDPNYGQMLGVARCIRAELDMDFVTLELDNLDNEASQAVALVIKKVQQAQKMATDENDVLDIESEYVWRDGRILLSRFHTISVHETLANAMPLKEAKHLTVAQPGSLQSIRWTGHSLPPLADEDVQVRVIAAALNFHDVDMAMGIVNPKVYYGLGSEGTAIVTGVGADIKHVSVGDRVVVMGFLTTVLATEIQLPGILVVRAPENMKDEDAAGLVIPYVTVLWSLVEKAHMKRTQKLLIHDAAGAVGIAAIHVARWMGANIYCTVDSQAKIDFLTQELNVPLGCIFYSGDDSFATDLLRATGGNGVDVVLNSLSGELLHASWKCVASEGCMVDLGKQDVLGRGRLATRPFAENRAFFSIDLPAICMTSHHKVVPLLYQTVELLRDGHIFPLYSTTVFDAERIQDAFTYMQKDVHIGQIIIKMPADPSNLPMTQLSPKPSFKHDVVYLLAGGLGGLGRSIISWMVSHGARHLMVISPSAGTLEEHRLFKVELRELGCELHCFSGDVADYDFVRNVVAVATRPIKGVIQLAMVLRDTGILNMDHDSWVTATNPKIKGTWNLHQLLPKDMDFFVMCSSISGALGSYGQANYAAANTFLDAFVHFRHELGLPAAALDIAAVGDVGYVASTKDVAERLERSIARFMSEGDFLQCLQLAVKRSSKNFISPAAPTVTIAYEEVAQLVLYNEMTHRLSDPQNTIPWCRDPRLSVFRNNQDTVAKGDGADTGGLRSFLVSLSSEPARLDDPLTATFFAYEIAKRILALLMKKDVLIDTSKTLRSLGADSQVLIEIRSWWKQNLGIEITIFELADAGNSMEILGKLAVQRLRARLSSK